MRFGGKLTGAVIAELGREVGCKVGMTVGAVVAIGLILCCMEGVIVGKGEGNLDETILGESDGNKVGGRVEGSTEGVQLGEAVGGLDGVTEGE